MVLGPARRVTSRLVPTARTFAAADGHGLYDLRLVLRKSFAGVDDAVEEDHSGGPEGGSVRVELCCARAA